MISLRYFPFAVQLATARHVAVDRDCALHLAAPLISRPKRSFGDHAAGIGLALVFPPCLAELGRTDPGKADTLAADTNGVAVDGLDVRGQKSPHFCI